MRIIVMFDLPVVTSADRREYRKFRKHLITNGFMMLQESVYCKLVANSAAAEWQISDLYKNKPVNGLVQAIRVTEKQFSNMEYIVGEKHQDVVDSDERILFL